MSDTAKIRAELEIVGQEGIDQLKARLNDVNDVGAGLAAALGRDEISAAEFNAEAKQLAASIKNLEQAIRALEAAQDAQIDRLGEQVALEIEAAAAAERLAGAKAREAAQADLAEQSERQALAIQHEIEMLEHEQRELAAATAEREQYNAVINREIAALEASERERLQQAGATTQETTAEARAREATERETAALWSEVAAMENAEREALQFANAEFAAAGSMEHFTVDASAAASAASRLNAASGTTRGGMGSLQQSITAGSYAFQDFTATSGDLGAKLNSVSNNLPTLLIGLGGLGTALAVAGTAAIAVYRNWDSIAGLWEERNPFPKAADDIAAMKRELDAAKESTEKLEKAGTGNAKQIAEYNGLIETTARLEKEIADQQERQNLLKQLRSGKTEEQEGRAKGFTEATKGTDVESKLREAYENDKKNELKQAAITYTIRKQAIEQSNKSEEEKADLIKAEAEKLHAASKRLSDPSNDPAKLAEDLYVRLGRGEELAFQALDRLMNETGVTFGDLRDRMRKSNPHLKKIQDEIDKETDAWAKEGEEFIKQREAAEKKKADREIDEWAKEGEDFLRTAAAAKKKRDAAEVARMEEALTEEIEETERRNKAEAARIHKGLGNEAGKQFGETVAEEVLKTGEDPEKVAAVLAGQKAAMFRGLGFGQGAAQLAAQQLAGQGGIRLTIPQIRGMQPGLESAVPARRRPKPGKKPPPKPAPKPPPRVTGEVEPQVSPQILAARQADAARRKAAEAARAKIMGPQGPKAPVVPRVVPVQSPTGRHVPREVLERQKQLAVQAANKQASIVPAVRATQDALSATQAATRANKDAIAQLNMRAHQQRREAEQLLTRANESGPTALNFA